MSPAGAQGQVAPAITSANNTTFTVGTAGSFTVTATGSPTPSLSESGALPSGLTFNATTGLLSGIPASGTAGTYPITFTAQNTGIAPNVLIQEKDAYFANPSGAASESIALGSPVTSTDLLFCMVGWETAGGSLITSVTDSLGNSYSALPLVVNSPHQMQGFYAFSAASGTNAVKVNFNGTGGTYIGMACAEWSGPAHLDVQAEAIGIGITPSSAALTPSAAGELLIGYADDSGNNWSASSPWTLISSTGYVRYGLEDQLSSTANPAASAFTIGSAPWAAGIAAFSSSESAAQNFALTVTMPSGAPSNTLIENQAPAITSANNTTFTVGTAGSFTVTATGSPTPSLSESGALPSGLTFNATTGLLSGIPASGTAGTYPITFTAQNTGIAPNVLIQEKDAYFANPSGAASESIALGSPVTSTDLLFCMVGWETAGGSLITSVTDSLGNSYSALPLVVNSPHQMQGFYAFSAASGTNAVKVNFNGTGGTYIGMACAEWSGPAHLDVQAEAIGIGITPSSAALTPSAAGELLIGYADDSGNNWSASSPWTLVSSTGYVRYGLEDQLSSTANPAASAFTIGSAPWAAGIAAFSNSESATQNFALSVILPSLPPSITSATSTTFTAGIPGSFTVTATGFPVPILSESGALPTGVSFDPTTGVLAGTPAATTGGIYPITITAQNGVGTAASQSFTLTIDQAPAITSVNNTTFTVGAPGSFTVTATGSPQPTLSESGTLPSGVTFNAFTGALSGTPAAGAGGFYPITITAQNGVGTVVSQSFTLAVDQAPIITSANNATFTVGSPGVFTLTATGSPAPSFYESGVLPAGVMLNATTGVLSGTPATSGAYTLTITAGNGAGTDATQNFTLTVMPYQAPAITSANDTTFTVGTAGSFTVTATGSPTPSLSESGALPSGLTFNATTGLLSGIPASGTAGTYPITFTAQNTGIAPNVLIQEKDAYFANPSGAASESIALGSPVTSTDLLFCMVGWETAGGSLITSVTDSLGNSYSALPLVVNSPHQMQGFYAFSAASGTNAVKVNFNGTGGTYIGMACAEWSGPAHLDVQAEAIGIGITPSSAALTPSAAGELLIGYADDSGNNWSASSPWTLISSTGYVRYGLEDQLSSTANPAASAFTIGSAPWAAGVAAFASSGIISTTQDFNLSVILPSVPPSITSATSTTFTAGIPGSFTVTATGYPAPILSESGALPTGVTFNSTTGVLAGTPAAGTAGIYPLTITAHNGVGSDATQSFTLNVTAISLVSIAITPANPAITKGGTQQFTAIGTYSDTSTVNLTSTAVWNSANPTIATINPAGLATGLSAGTSAITATFGSVTSNIANLKVNPGVPVYPLKIGATGRYLVDQNDVPFMILGDSPQSMVGNLSEADAATYFANRQSLGFNSVWISILCDPYIYCSSTGTTVDGIPAFTTSGDLATPNPSYFQRVDDIINLAAQYGITVFLDPIETGGWLTTLESNGVTADYNYGLYLGNRYKSFPNIVWLNGNDFQTWQSSPSDDADVTAVAKGIQAADPNHIQTVELNYFVSTSLDDPNWAGIVGLNAVYSYYPTYAEMYHGYDQSSSVPIFLVEAHYESEDVGGDDGTPTVLRQQEYWTMLSGATGQLYGNHYTTGFLSGWQSNLNTTGTTQLGYFQALFKPLAWYNLVPDQSNTLITAGFGTFATSGTVSGNNYVTGAMTLDGSLAMAYVPAAQAITVNMAKLGGPITAQWFDPTNGTYTTVAGSPFANSGSMQFTPLPTNSGGGNDWLLLLTASVQPDTQPPSVPENLMATAISPSQINLSWSASTDNVAVTGYQVFRSGVQIATTTATNYSDTGLNANTSYSYAVAAFDGAGNISAQSVPTTATTPVPDTTPPTVPTNLQASNVTSTSATISWTASTDNVAVAGYQVYRNGALIGTTSQTFYDDNGLSPSTAYTYTVTAYDTSGNVSAQSQPLSLTTTAHIATPAFVQQNYAVPQTAQSSVNVTYSNPQVAGDTNIVVIGWSDTTASIASVTDSSGNTYQVALPTATSRLTPESQAIYYAPNISAATRNVVTVTFSQAADAVDLRITEYSGLSQTNPFDVGSTATGSAGTANSNAVNTSASNELLFGAGLTAGDFTGPGSGYTARVITSPDADIIEDQVVTSVGSYSATASVNNYWLMQIATFRAAGSP